MKEISIEEIADYMNDTGEEMVCVCEVQEHFEQKYETDIEEEIIKEKMIECAEKDLIAFYDTGESIIDYAGEHYYKNQEDREEVIETRI